MIDAGCRRTHAFFDDECTSRSVYIYIYAHTYIYITSFYIYIYTYIHTCIQQCVFTSTNQYQCICAGPGVVGIVLHVLHEMAVQGNKE